MTICRHKKKDCMPVIRFTRFGYDVCMKCGAFLFIGAGHTMGYRRRRKLSYVKLVCRTMDYE